MALRWQQLEVHERDFKLLCGELGFLDNKNQIRRFDGFKFWPRWVALGHTKTNFDDCECRMGILGGD